MKSALLLLTILFSFTQTAQVRLNNVDRVKNPASGITETSVMNQMQMSQWKPQAPTPPCLRDSSRIHDDGLGTLNLYRYSYTSNGLLAVTNCTQYSATDTSYFLFTDSYTAANMLSQRLSQIKQGQNWVNFYLTTYTYNPSNKCTRQKNFTWDASFNGWTDDNEFLYTYDNTQHLISSQLNIVINNAPIAPYGLITYSYNTASQVIREVGCSWFANAWLNNSETINAYANAQAVLPSVETTSVWDSINQAWKPWMKINSVSSGTAMSSFTVQMWQLAGNTWTNNTKRDFSYDASGRNTLDILYNWNNGWSPLTRNTTTLSPSAYYVTLIESYNQNNWENVRTINRKYNSSDQLVREYHEQWNFPGWATVYDQYEFYDCTTIGLPKVADIPEPQIWPNPTGSRLHIQSNSSTIHYRVMDLQGRSLLEGEGVDPELNMEALSAGVYLIKVQNSDGHAFVRRIIRQ